MATKITKTPSAIEVAEKNLTEVQARLRRRPVVDDMVS